MATAARTAFVLLLLALAGCSAQRGSHLEPQTPPANPKAIVQSLADPDTVLTTNYPALIHTYVQRLCPQGDSALREEDFLRAARLVAFASIKDGWTPRAVTREFVRGQLDAEALPFLSAGAPPRELAPSVVIDQLVQCGLLEQIVALAAAEIRFSLDPVAEYLAAMHVVMLERGTLAPKLADPLPDTPFAEALRSIRAASAVV